MKKIFISVILPYGKLVFDTEILWRGAGSSAKENPRVVALTGDLAPATESDLFREAFPADFLHLE